MAAAPQLCFGPFRLDPNNSCLWQGRQEVPLRAKPFAVLHYLVAHAGRLVTKKELFAAVWPDTAIGDAVLKVCIGEIRKALGDTAKTPQFIATLHRRGYRFIIPVTAVEPTAAPTPQPITPIAPPASRQLPIQATAPLVEREAVLDVLRASFERASRGERQTAFVTGEPGIGKTAVVEAFLVQAASTPHAYIARGQCVEQFGAGEAYLPVLDAIGQLCRGEGGQHLITLLRQQAPTWLVQMPWLLTAADRERLQQELQGTTRERMLRELAEVLDAFTAERPLVLVLEDLHWSDFATLDLVALLARRRMPAQLLVIGTYRPVEVIVHAHPLHAVKQELQLHGHCTELALAPLSEAAVAAYLVERFPGHRFPATLATWLHQHTDGNPLFLVTMAQALMEQGMLQEESGKWALQGEVGAITVGVPESLRATIEQQMSRLPPETQRVLEAASVAGMEFSAATVAAGIELGTGEIEEQCGALMRHQILRSAGVAAWPDGTVSGRYAFGHALYQQVIYQQLGEARRMRLHQRIGAHLEKAYSFRVGEIAAELAEHFVRGRETRRAVQYLRQAAETAARRCAYREVIVSTRRALELIDTIPESPERTQLELSVQLALGTSLMATRSYAAPETGQAYSRALELCQQVDASRQRFTALRGLWQFHLLRAELRPARALGEDLLGQAQRVHDPSLLLEAHRALGSTLYWCGEFATARAHFAQGMARYDPQQHHTHAFLYGLDPGVTCLTYMALALWGLGYPDQAYQRGEESLALARQLAHPVSLTFALTFTAMLHQFRREASAAQACIEADIAIATEQGFRQWIQMDTFLHGWALAEQGNVEEGIAEMRQGMAAWRAMGADLHRPYFLALLAEAQAKVGQAEEGLRLLAEAFTIVRSNGESLNEAELYRLQGELLLTQASTQPKLEQAEVSMRQALAVARQQQAKSLELRAAMSLSRLWRRQGKSEEALQLLSEVYDWFTEGFETADLQEAKILLATLQK